jgi:hypothetical protein
MKVKQYIVTYNNQIQINNCLESIFSKLNNDELSILDIFIINNHSDLNIDVKYLDKITILNNSLRPDFSTGHLSRNWNQAIINGFKDLKNPDCDIVVTNQDDTLFKENYISKLIELHNNFDLIQFGWGDNFISYTPNAIKQIGLWDERFCNIGYQEADYFTRAALYLKSKSSINDFSHNRILNGVDESNWIIDIIPSGNARGEEYHHTSSGFHSNSKYIYETKWEANPDDGFLNIETIEPKMNSFIMYPYFEKDIETLDEQYYLYKF